MPFLLGSEEHTSELQSPCNLVCRFFFDRKSTRLNSSHLVISYAVFCLKKKSHLLTWRWGGREQAAVPGECPGGAVHFFFNDTATTEIYPLSLHDALPI